MWNILIGFLFAIVCLFGIVTIGGSFLFFTTDDAEAAYISNTGFVDSTAANSYTLNWNTGYGRVTTTTIAGKTLILQCFAPSGVPTCAFIYFGGS